MVGATVAVVEAGMAAAVRKKTDRLVVVGISSVLWEGWHRYCPDRT